MVVFTSIGHGLAAGEGSDHAAVHGELLRRWTLPPSFSFVAVRLGFAPSSCAIAIQVRVLVLHERTERPMSLGVV